MSSPPVTATARQGLLWSFTNNLSLRVGNVVVSVVMARLLSPGEFGVFAVALTVHLVLGVLAELGLGADLVRSSDPESRAPSVATLAFVAACLSCAGMVAGAGPLARAFGAPEAEGVIRLMSGSLLLSGLSVVPAALLQREFQQRRLFAADAGNLGVSTLITVGLALAGLGPLALAWGRIAGQATTTLLHFVLARRLPRFGADREVLTSVLRFGAPLAAANLLSWLVLTMDNLVVARTSGAVVLGLYVIAFNVSSWPMSAIGQAVRVVALPAFARDHEARQHEAVLMRAVTLAWTGALAVGGMLAALAEPLLRGLYGDRWVPAAGALTGLAMFGALRVVFDLIATYLIARGATPAVLAVQVVWALALVPAIALGLELGGLAGAGWAHVALAALVVLPGYGAALRRSGLRPGALLNALLLPTAVALPAICGAWWTAQQISNPLLAVPAGAGVGLVLFTLPLLRRTCREARLLLCGAPGDVPPRHQGLLIPLPSYALPTQLQRHEVPRP